MGKEEVLKKLKADFIAEDLAEPFINREYVEETLRIYDLLIDGFDLGDSQTDNATQDIIGDIFRYYESGDDFERLIRKKVGMIRKGVKK